MSLSYQAAQMRSVDLRIPAGELVLHAAKSATNRWDGVIIDMEKGALTTERRGFSDCMERKIFFS